MTAPATPARTHRWRTRRLQAEDVDAHGLGRLSSSRIATQPRPMRELLSRTNTKITKRDQHQEQEVIVGEAAERDTQDGVRIAEVEPEKGEVGNRGMPLDPCVMSGPASPSKLIIVMRKISPKASVTMAR